MGKIFLVRHGQDQDNLEKILNGRRDTGLTELGKAQAKKVSVKLLDNNIQLIYSSPLKRTVETAQIIASELKINNIIIEELLIERDFGILTGEPVAFITKYTNKIIHSDGINYFLEAEGAENFPNLYERGKKFLKKMGQYSNINILIVTHGDIGKMIRAAYYDWGWEKGLKTPHFGNTNVLKLDKNDDIVRL